MSNDLATPAVKSSLWVSAVILGVSLWAILYPHPYPLVMSFLALAPLIPIAILWRSSRSGAVGGSSENKDLAHALVLPPLVLGLRPLLDLQMVEPLSGFVPGLLLAIPFFVVTLWSDRSLWSPGAILVLLVLSFSWGWGSLLAANRAFDPNPPKVVSATVIEQSAPRHHRLTVTAVGLPSKTTVAVLRAQFDVSPPGTTVCVADNTGALGWRFIMTTDCPAAPPPRE